MKKEDNIRYIKKTIAPTINEEESTLRLYYGNRLLNDTDFILESEISDGSHLQLQYGQASTFKMLIVNYPCTYNIAYVQFS